MSIYIAEYDSATGEFYNSAGGFAFGLSASNAASNGDGSLHADAERIWLIQPLSVAAQSWGVLPTDCSIPRMTITHRQTADAYQMYADNAGASWPIGDMATFESPANVEACQACHGTPYRKHGNSPGVVAGAPDFTYCRWLPQQHKPMAVTPSGSMSRTMRLTWATDGLAGATAEQLSSLCLRAHAGERRAYVALPAPPVSAADGNL